MLFEHADKVGAIVKAAIVAGFGYILALGEHILCKRNLLGLDICLKRGADVLAEIVGQILRCNTEGVGYLGGGLYIGGILGNLGQNCLEQVWRLSVALGRRVALLDVVIYPIDNAEKQA